MYNNNSLSFQKFTVFSLLLADTVRINAEGVPEILTKIAKDFVSVSYNINDKVGLSSMICGTVYCSEWCDFIMHCNERGADQESSKATLLHAITSIWLLLFIFVFRQGNDKDGEDDDVIDVENMDDEDKGMRRSGRQKDERAAVESAASKRASRQVHLAPLHSHILLSLILRIS